MNFFLVNFSRKKKWVIFEEWLSRVEETGGEGGAGDRDERVKGIGNRYRVMKSRCWGKLY